MINTKNMEKETTSQSGISQKSVAVLQSNYIPWKGYFDIVNSVDEFIWYDDVQYTKNDWRNRNKIKTGNGSQWLTVPCSGKGGTLINQVELNDTRWQKKHWSTISQAYSKAPYFHLYKDFFEDIYLGQQWAHLSEMNKHIVEIISRDFLSVKTNFLNSCNFHLCGQKQQRLLDLLEQTGADTYVSGPSAMSYIDEAEFANRGIELRWHSYEGYPEYPQLHGEFDHAVSIIDMLFNLGEETPWYIWGWRKK